MYSLCQTMNDVCDYVKGEASNWGLVRLHPPFIHFLDIKGGKRPLDWFQLCPWPLPTDISGWYLSVIPEFTPRKNLRINQIDAKVLCSREHALLHIPQAQARTILFRERRAPSVMTCTGANNVKKGWPAATSGSSVSCCFLNPKKKFPLKAHSIIIRVRTSPTLRKHPKSSYEKFADKVRRKGQASARWGEKMLRRLNNGGKEETAKYTVVAGVRPVLELDRAVSIDARVLVTAFFSIMMA